MITDSNKAEIIEQYFKGLLDQETRHEFLKKYSEDETFKTEVDQYRFIIQTFKHLSTDSEKRIEEFLELNKGQSKSFNFFNYRSVFGIAASLAVIISLSVYFFTIRKNSADAQISQSKIYSIPLFHLDNMGFNSRDNFPVDSIFLVIGKSDGYQGYYQFYDTLFLQLPKEPDNIQSIKILKTDVNYVLEIDSVKFVIRPGIKKLQKLEKFPDHSK